MLTKEKNQIAELAAKHRATYEEISDPRRASRLLDFYVRLIPRALEAERCSIFIHDPAQRKAWLKAGTGISERGIEVPLEDSLVGKTIRTGDIVTDFDLQSRNGLHKSVDTTTGFTTREIMCIPIRSSVDRNKITGAIEVLNKKSGGRFSGEDQEFLEELGEHIQSSIESAYRCQEAVEISRGMMAVVGKAMYVGALGGGVTVFIAAMMVVYMGLPSWFGA